MKQILSYKNNADIPIMTALREQVTYVIRIHLVQQIVENYETRSTEDIAFIMGNTLVKADILMYRGQLLAGNGRLLALTPDDPASKIRFRTQRIGILQKTQGKR